MLLRSIIVLFLVAMVSSVSSYGQKNAFTFGGGYSLPIGKFASKAFDDPKAGMADAGYFGQVGYERKLSPWLGLRLSANYNINQTNPEPLVEEANYLVETYRMFIGEEGQYSWESQAYQWKLASLMFGPALYLPLGPLTLEAHAQGGRLIITSPKVTLHGTSTSGNNPITAILVPVKTQSWGFAGGLSLRIPLGSVVQFKLFAEAIAAEATFKDIGLKGTIGDLEVDYEISETRPVGLINTGAGFVFRF